MLQLQQYDYRLGYACQNMSLPGVTAAHRVTAKHLQTLSRTEQLNKMREILQLNLKHLEQILEFNVEHGIKLYRIPSEIVPLATHEMTIGWDYFQEYREQFREIGAFALEHGLRLSLHLTQYTFLNSPRKRVWQQALADIKYHTGVLDVMGLDEEHVVVMHVGGIYGDKEKAIQRFYKHFEYVDEKARRRLALENDDKCYHIGDVLAIAKEVKLPVIFDYHHHRCLPNGQEMFQFIQTVSNLWQGKRMKMHFSSPKSPNQFRSHSDFIDVDDFYHFYQQLKALNIEKLDIMLECKAKDQALLALREDLQKKLK